MTTRRSTRRSVLAVLLVAPFMAQADGAGSLYMSMAAHGGTGHTTHAFAVFTAVRAGAAIVATATAHRATRPRNRRA